jgi:ferrochelatase
VLLIGFGGPERPEEVRPFLETVTAGRNVPRDRLDEVARHYERIGGASPFNRLTFAQADALRAELASRRSGVRVYVGMRNWHPFLKDVVAQMADDGVTRTAGVILAAHRSEASDQAYRRAVEQARAALGGRAPAIRYVRPWFDEERFVDALAARVAEGLSELPEEARDGAAWLFTAHSLPSRMPGADTYVADLKATGGLLAARFGRPWRLVFQSRSGGPHDPWLEPDVCDAMREEAGRGAAAFLVVPIGFLCDHVEVLYDLDVEAAEVAGALHRPFARAPAVGTHPAFISLVADRALEALRA